MNLKIKLKNRINLLIIVLYLFIISCQNSVQSNNSGEVIDIPDFENKQGIGFIYEAADYLLSLYVNEQGLVNYTKLYQNSVLKLIIDTIAIFKIETLNKKTDSLAFFINAYNFIVLNNIKNYGLKDEKVDFALFDKKFLIAGNNITLNELEKNNPLFIKKFNEPRTHFALVCAALSCPPLINRAYRGDDLYEQLDKQAFNFINNNEFNEINSTGTPVVSELFNWYKDDVSGFVRDTSESSLLKEYQGNEKDFIASYCNDIGKMDNILQSTLDFKEYNWAINKQVIK